LKKCPSHALWMSKYNMNDDFIVLNGDNYITDIVVEKILASDHDISMVIDRKSDYTEDDMKVITKDDKVLFVGKKLNIKSINGESIGMIRFKNEGAKKLKETLDIMVKINNAKKLFWLAAIQKIMDDRFPVNYIEVPIDSWAEIDVHKDYKYLRKLVNDKIKEVDKLK